jgi:hypothetical protein
MGVYYVLWQSSWLWREGEMKASKIHTQAETRHMLRNPAVQLEGVLEADLGRIPAQEPPHQWLVVPRPQAVEAGERDELLGTEVEDVSGSGSVDFTEFPSARSRRVSLTAFTGSGQESPSLSSSH